MIFSPSLSPFFAQLSKARWSSSLLAIGGGNERVVAGVSGVKSNFSDGPSSQASFSGSGLAAAAAVTITSLVATSLFGTSSSCEKRNLCIKDPNTEYYSVLAHDEPERYDRPEETSEYGAVAATMMAPSPSVKQYDNGNNNNNNNNSNNNHDEEISPQSPVGVAAATAALHELTAEEKKLEDAAIAARKHAGGLKLFSGNGNIALSQEIAKILGINLGKATVGRFADGEVNVMIHENVRGKDVYIIQPTCPPVNENLMELLLMVSTLNRASARRITVVIPYYGYARQDRKMQARVPISAADVARLLEAMGIDRVIAVDLHCGQIQGFFGPRVPVDNLDGGIVGINHFGDKDLHNPVIVSPDAGGVYRAKKFMEGLSYKFGWDNIGLAMIIKQRVRAGHVDQMDLVGDVNDSDCIIVDDMIDTAGTICKAAEVLKEKGARRVFAFASHGLLSGPGNDRIANSVMEECVILNTIPSSQERDANQKLVQLSVAPLLAQTIFNIHAKKSISALFK